MYWALYRLSISVYYLLVRIVSLGNEKAKKFVKGRSIGFSSYEKDQRFKLWVHVSSLGEFEQSRPVIERLKAQFDLDITLTFFSPSGYEVKKNYEKVDRVLYMPIDLPEKARSFIHHFQFDLALFVKYDFWMNHLRACHDAGIPVVFISVILRPDQLYFTWARGFYLPVFRKVDHFFVQNKATQELLKEHQVESSTVSGDTRLDRVVEIASKAPKIDLIEQLTKERKVFVMGSVWPSDDDFLQPIYEKYRDEVLFILAPHDISEASVSKFTKGKEKTQLFTQNKEDKPTDFLIIDNMGMLAGLYAYADLTYVGGGFRGTLHNTMEAAAHGKPVFFGKHEKNRKFKEAGELVDAGGGFEVDASDHMIILIEELLADQTKYESVCEASSDYVRRHSGATDVIVDYIKSKMP